MPKNIAVFCDGTWNRADQTTNGRPCPTNVLRLFESTRLEDKKQNPQLVHYIAGIGTRRSERITGGGFGFGISDNIKNGYQFIVSNYDKGDRIFLFGFSRGAYTARSIAGLIHNVGILNRNELHRANEAYRNYKDRSAEWHPDSAASQDFRRQYTHRDEKIAFLGVWDTVGALGAPYGRVVGWVLGQLFKFGFHDVKLSSTVESAYHALAIDEKRWPFRPTLWELSDSHKAKNTAASPQEPYYEEKWFHGVHSNVGGGYPDTGLSDISLEWMAERAIRHGLNIDLDLIASPPFRPSPGTEPDVSQTLGYQIMTALLVKLPSLVSKRLIASGDADLVRHIDWKGDYNRPVGAPAKTTASAAREPELVA